MPDAEKPRHRSGYSSEETEQVRAACLTVAITLGAYLDDICIVGGLVPTLLIDTARADESVEDRHPGTNDLDIGLALALLDDERYAEISDRLRREGFAPDTSPSGNPTVQRWRLGELKVTIDFLMPPAPGHDPRLRVQNLQPDFGAVITPGLELAFDELTQVQLDGRTLHGEPARRTVPVCDPAAFIVLRALAFGDRPEPKDAYDLVYVLRYTPGRGEQVAQRLAEHASVHHATVTRALALLDRDFAAIDDLGPRRAASFIAGDRAELDDAAADAHRFVDDLLRACRNHGLIA